MSEFDSVGQRMKDYEKACRSYLDPDSWMVLRLDGRCFHTWTRGLERPYDVGLLDAMGATAQAVCEDISGSVLAYTQSDEISVLFTDTASEKTEAWFGGQIQKITSVSASVATAHFGRCYLDRRPATFDARVFVLPPDELGDYFNWRRADCERNAISMLSSFYFSHKSLIGKGLPQRREMLAEKGIVVEDCDERFLYGQLLTRESRTERVEYIDKRTNERRVSEPVTRRYWRTTPCPPLPMTLDLLGPAT